MMDPLYDSPENPLGHIAVLRYYREHSDASPSEVADAFLARVSDKELRFFAREAIMDEVRRAQRFDARQVETAAASASPAPTFSPRIVSGESSRFEMYRDNPDKGFLSNVRERQDFRKWMGDSFEQWYQATYARKAAAPLGQVERFEADWYEGGIKEFYREKTVTRLVGVVKDWVAKAALDIRLELTQELLDTAFALGDGMNVRWGNATVEQHETRIEMLVRHGAAELETAARHQAAINMLRDADKTCLYLVAPQQAG